MVDSNPVLQEKLNKAWKFFFKRGFIDGFGHISARTQDPDRILISPHELTASSSPADFVEIDLDGNQFGTDAPMPGELPIHLEVYKARPDVNAVAHFHPHNATSFSMSEHDLKPTYFLASIFRDGIPVHPDSRLIKTADRAKAMVETLGDRRGMLLRAHGIVVTGPSVEWMTGGVFIMEDNAKRTQIAASMGDFETLSEDDMAEIQPELMGNPGPIWRIWKLVESEAAG